MEKPKVGSGTKTIYRDVAAAAPAVEKTEQRGGTRYFTATKAGGSTAELAGNTGRDHKQATRSGMRPHGPASGASVGVRGEGERLPSYARVCSTCHCSYF